MKTLERSFHIRETAAGSCNGCEVEIVGSNGPDFGLKRFCIHFVASRGAVDTVSAVDVCNLGCLPNPFALLHGIRVVVGRLPRTFRRETETASAVR